MSKMRWSRPKYAVDPLSAFPKKWRDHIGPIRVMTEPVEGYVMVRRPRGMPFVLQIAEILNARAHPNHGPFEMMGRAEAGDNPCGDRQ